MIKITNKKMKNIWTLINRIKLTEDISKFEFSCQEVSIKNHVKGVNWFGRHFSVTSINSSLTKIRLYTTVLSYTQGNIQYRENLLVYFDKVISQGPKQAGQIPETPPLTFDLLPLIIKRYDIPHSLSSFLHLQNHEATFGPTCSKSSCSALSITLRSSNTSNS